MRYRSTSLLAIAFIAMAALTATAQTPSASVAPQLAAQPTDGWTVQAPPPPPPPPEPPAPPAPTAPKVVRESGTATPRSSGNRDLRRRRWRPRWSAGVSGSWSM